MKERTKPLFAGANDEGKRLDRVLRRCFPRLALSGIYRLIRRGRITVNGQPASISRRLKAGDRIDIAAAVEPPARFDRPPSSTAIPGRLSDFILFQNEHVLALNKPYGLLVHGQGSLTDLVNASVPEVAPSLSFRPGPVHRLDRNTTGVQVFGLSLFGARRLSRLFHARRAAKIYCALVSGNIDRPLEWEDELVRDRALKKTTPAGRSEGSAGSRGAHSSASGVVAATSVLPLFSNGTASLVFFLPKTGRTHQLRSQSAFHGHPLLGDRKYGGAPSQPRYLLHCLGLALSSADWPLPPFFAPCDRFALKTIEALFGKNAVGQIYRRARELLAAP